MIYLLIVFAVACVVGCFAAWLKMVKQDGEQFASVTETQTETYKKAN
ncbi:hypothetical protein [Terribacillus saccharophilus]|nr:hypothetical protein [Terribacillus saccharophilus]MEC0304335.1 hypothetical protein [Terribacillus saccharophilus]